MHYGIIRLWGFSISLNMKSPYSGEVLPLLNPSVDTFFFKQLIKNIMNLTYFWSASIVTLLLYVLSLLTFYSKAGLGGTEDAITPQMFLEIR